MRQNQAERVVPYMASAEWYACWLKPHLAGIPDEIAIKKANALCGISGKDFSRCTVEDTARRPLMLSVAVEGGSPILKRRNGPEKAMLSGHGNWPHVHLGALDACYGRTPFYQHIMPLLRPAYENPEASLMGFCESVHKTVLKFLGINGEHAAYNYLQEVIREQTSPAALRGKEIAATINPRISVADALMRHGPETLLGLLFLDNPGNRNV